MRFINNNNRMFRIIQHFLVAFIAFVLVYTFTGSSIVLSGFNGDFTYNLYKSDRNRKYEDSYLFNNILGNNTANVIKLVSERTQLESGSNYDGDKEIDVTAFVNRGSILPGDYITAVYSLSDLLKWGHSGFDFETRDFTEAQSASFLNSYTTYTHLNSNITSGGMNSYLSSQIEGNSSTFNVDATSVPEGGTHSIFISRYQTVDGKNIEDLVSSWDEYELLCNYIQEAIRQLTDEFNEYNELIDYYSYFNSNMRYYVSRTINGKTERYTNINELSKGTVGVDINSLFDGYGRYIYYCPYELKYMTNTQLSESVFRSLLSNYEYVFPDQIKIFIGVDTNDYPCSDEFTQGKENFFRYIPYRTQMLLLCVIAFILYIGIMLLVTRSIKLTASDMVLQNPAKSNETVILLGLIIIAIPVLTIYGVHIFSKISYLKMLQYKSSPYFAFISLFIIDAGFLYCFYEIYERIVNGTFWNNCLLKNLVKYSKNVITNATDNTNVFIRSWIPYLVFIFLNIGLFRIGIVGIIMASFLDLLVGIYLYRQNLDRDRIIHVIEKIKNGDVKSKVDLRQLHSDNISLAEAVNSIGEGIEKAVDTSMKDEKLKADLITNVSHDIKTPLTSIINYTGLIKRENIDNPKIKEYVDVLESKSYKLKQLIEDLLEASKISSGNISIQLDKINFVEFVNQTIGEFYEKFEKSSLIPVFKPSEPNISVMADPRHLWRVIENLFNNVCKYALPGTRVYMDMKIREDEEGKKKVALLIKNISARELNVDAEDLTERFIRGDESRTTEGSGLGLSIAKNLTVAMGGDFKIRLDGDLFKVIIEFDHA